MKRDKVIDLRHEELYLIKFHSSRYPVVCDQKSIITAIKSQDTKNIQFIKCLDTFKQKFTRISKPDLLARVGWDTETIQYLFTLPYFEGVLPGNMIK